MCHRNTNGTTTYLYGTDGRQLKSVGVGWPGVHTRSCEIQSLPHLAMFIFVDFHISYKMCRYVNNPSSCQFLHVKLQFNCSLVISGQTESYSRFMLKCHVVTINIFEN